MVKAADALATAVHVVRMASTRHVDCATRGDASMRVTRSWRWRVVDYQRPTAPWTYFWSGARQRLANSAVERLGPDAVPISCGIRAYARVHDELVRAATEEPV